MKYNKNAETFLSPLLFTSYELTRKKILKKHYLFISSLFAQKSRKAASSGSTLPQYLPNP